VDVRTAFTAILLAITWLTAFAQQPAPPTPRFQSRVELITIDVAAVDKDGRPVEDLRAGDFAVKIDGRNRPVVSAQLVRVDRSRAGSVQPADPLIATNDVAGNGRRVVVAVDQTLIAPGSIAPVLRSATRFVDALAPTDYAAVLAFPEPGPRVDFTTDKARAREALQRIVGQPAKSRTSIFNLSLVEAQTIDRSERTLVNPLAGSFEAIWATVGLTMKRVLARGCRSLTLEELKESQHGEDFQQCLRDLSNQAMVEALENRTEAIVSLGRLESYLRELAILDGPKSMILVSAGLLADDEKRLEDVARLAADARTTINVVAVDRERERDNTDLPNGQSSMKLQDRALELHGLETLADRTGGALYRAIGPAEGVFARLELELSAAYIVGVERREGDPDRQRIEIAVKRRGVTVRSPRTATSIAAVNAQRAPQDVLRDALASPLPIPGLPVRLSTFVRREAAGQMYRLQLAAQIGQPGASGGEFAVGYAVIDQQDRLVSSFANRTQLTSSGDPGEPLPYDATVNVALQPGVYSVRFAVVDSDGHRGTAVRRLELPVAGGQLTTSDLVVGSLGVEGGTLRPSVEARVGGHIAAHVEIYPPDADQGAFSVNLEIAEGAASPALASATLTIGAGAQPGWRVASGALDVALLPGKYVARASVRREGIPVRVVARPFVLERSVVTPTATVRSSGASLSPEVRARTAGYVSAFVRGLANVVGEEAFVLRGPDRRVTSDFLLVRHPALVGDFVTFRDVATVNGTDIPDRQERLADLFLKPIGLVRDRVREITLAAEQHVPSVLNPIFVLAFLQSDFQSRFEFTVTDANGDWPPAVRAVTFAEMARPTLLRGGVRGDLDLPVRGTAWIEPDTGRVLQTELVVGTGRSATRLVTRFTLDSHLQIMVPEQMRTENPDGVATYGNFRRFNVQTETTVATPP
jgi:VWFA-related protein